jgi:peptidoglycan/LPS O-acetylase OafA/YrhL
MLLYLINVVDNTWVLAVAAPMILYFLKSDKARKGIRRLVWAAAALGLVASAVLAALRLNTGWVIREFYDLGVLVPLLGALLVFIVLSTVAKTGSCLKSTSPDGGSAPVVKTKLDQIIPKSLEQELRVV